MRSAKAEQSPQEPAESVADEERLLGVEQEPAESVADQERLLCAGQSYLARLGIVYMEQIRLTIVTELYMREMSVNQFYETIGGSSYDSIYRHFRKLVEYGWLRRVRTVVTGRGRPEALYRSTELPVIDTETWRVLPGSIRDAFTVQLLEEMGARLGGALGHGTADVKPDRVAVFRTVELDEAAWCEAHEAVERCFQTLQHEQIDAKFRLKGSSEKPILMVVNLAAFEAPGSADEVSARINSRLPKPEETLQPPPWPEPIGRVFTDLLDLRIVEELNEATMTAAELQATLGGTNKLGFLKRCKRLTELGLTVNTDTRRDGSRGRPRYQFRAAAPSISEFEIFERIPATSREGLSWEAFQRFITTSIAAVDAGTFNSRFDRHLTMSPLLVDEIGWMQVTEALQAFEASLLQLDDPQESETFRAAFLLSSFQAPLREMQP